MLKALELSGFKSFAERTKFVFPPGITVVVGPNGSGKSNVVDAIKWVLGEQSAKSLRGQEMADVIFKGSGNGDRKPANTAEATITFDNQLGELLIDAPEVHVTRRVFRSGEGEYLINRQPCRLRDVKDLFRGTGVGADAYSLIEQGKVDTLLQSSARDRRAIFEEAAGISRFRAKKVEAARRLERVEQNLLRLADVIEEIENRLRSLRTQAAKARRYQQYTQRWKELRTQVALVDWSTLSAHLNTSLKQRSELLEQLATVTARCEASEAHGLEIDASLAIVLRGIHIAESAMARHVQEIAVQHSTYRHQRERVHEYASAESRLRLQLLEVRRRADGLKSQLSRLTIELQAAEEADQKTREQISTHLANLEVTSQQLAAARQQQQRHESQQLAHARQVAAAAQQMGVWQSQEVHTRQASVRLERRIVELTDQQQLSRDQLQELQSAAAATAEEWQQLSAQRQELRRQADAVADELQESQERLQQIRADETAVRERLALLQELERRQEGVDTGVRDALAHAAAGTAPFDEVCGILADFIRADLPVAALVDQALGERAQYLIVTGSRLAQSLAQGAYSPPGRIGLLSRTAAEPRIPSDLRGAQLPGVIGRADQFVSTDDVYRPLVERLLGSTWLVESLADLLQLVDRFPEGHRFVTRDGAMLEEDGSLLVGIVSTSADLVYRRSQLRDLQSRHEHLFAALQQEEQAQAARRVQQDTLLRQLSEVTLHHDGVSARQADIRLQVHACQQRETWLEQQRIETLQEQETALADLQRTEQQLSASRQQAALLEQAEQQLQVELEESQRRFTELQAVRDQQARTVTDNRISAARCQQTLENLRRQWEQCEHDDRDRIRASSAAAAELQHCRRQSLEGELAMLRVTSAISEMAISAQGAEDQLRQRLAERDQLICQQAQHKQQLPALRQEIRECEQACHECERTADRFAQQRQDLEVRFRDELQIELAALAETSQANCAGERSEVDAEITDLRRKLSNMGAVNMEALHELEELEGRYQTLAGQLHDLTSAKQSLERIIQRINVDSRRLFTETLEAIRSNFQALFRKVFGGGKADIVLEGDADVLESGIDIVATPPGKHTLNLSLLSGGERALTAVTLLLAIFQFRPSPFCVLDEVDGPLDEANIGRFIEVLREFLGQTRFVVVTHSKKTMTAATTLYGITMQESGVSKQVSVRFEDVSDDGQIGPDPLDRGREGEQAA